MLQNLMDPFNLDVIKVTIKDKPGLPRLTSEESVKIVFEALRQYVQQEKRIRELRTAIEERNTKRRLRYCFETWHNHTSTTRKIVEYAVEEARLSNEKKIEMLVTALAEKQREMAEKPENERRTSETKSAPPKKNPVPPTKQKRALSCGAPPKNDREVPVRNRLEAQKLIIEEQRSQLAKQNRFIEEMKLKEIDKETRLTSKQTISMAKQALGQCDSRTRRSLIHLMREEGCRDASVTEIPQISSPPRFLVRMEERAEARKQRMKQAYETHIRQREEQRKRNELKQREAEEKQREQHIQALKEAKKHRLEQEAKRRKELEKNQKLENMADRFYKKYLFRQYIVEPLTDLVEEKLQCLKRADEFYAESLLLKIFTAWKNEWMEQQQAKWQLANKFHRHNILWYFFDEWKTYAQDMKQKYQVAVDFYDMKVQGKHLKRWHTLYVSIKLALREKELRAIRHYEKHLKVIYFHTWRRYMSLSDDILAREQRRDKWRDLIKQFSIQN